MSRLEPDDQTAGTTSQKAEGSAAQEPVTSGVRSAQVRAELEQLGGGVLIVAGVALTVLAAFFADNAVLAPIWAVLGASLIVLGCFSSRIEGGVEASRDGVKFIVRAIERVFRENRLMGDDEPSGREVLALIADSADLFEPPSNRPRDLQEAATAAVSGAFGFALSSLDRKIDLLRSWLTNEGYAVAENVVLEGAGEGYTEFDLAGSRPGGSMLLVELKIRSRPLSASDVDAVIGKWKRAQRTHDRAALAIAVDARTGFTKAAREAARLSEVTLLLIHESGWVERLTALG